jgi:hypothetical protein
MENIGYKAFPARGLRGSYFVWKGEANSNPGLVEAAKKAFNDPANTSGGLLKIMFGTQTVMEGVDFKNVNQIHILDPWWNDKRLEQVIARGIRLCSHKELPPENRIVNVFIHLSTNGSYEKVYDLKIMKGTHEKNVKSFMIPENAPQENSGLLSFRGAYVQINTEGEAVISDSQQVFYGHEIVPGSVRRGADQELNKLIGRHKKLDSRSVQEYMYERSLEKLNIARQFEKVIKEVAIDCSINKHGNVVRLNEVYKPSVYTENTWELFYENYSTGELFRRLNTKSVFTVPEILSNESLRSRSFLFKNTFSGEEKTINKSLIVSENIDCGKNPVYEFKFPELIANMSLNKELIPFLLKMDKYLIVDFFNNVQHNPSYRTTVIQDPKLHLKLKTLPTRKVSDEREKYIASLKEFGFNVNGDESLWDDFTLEQLKSNYEQINKFKKKS